MALPAPTPVVQHPETGWQGFLSFAAAQALLSAHAKEFFGLAPFLLKESSSQRPELIPEFSRHEAGES
jgi:hypothetical protein